MFRISDSGAGFQVLGLRFKDFRVEGSGFGVQGLECLGPGIGFHGSGFRFEVSGSRVHVLRFGVLSVQV